MNLWPLRHETVLTISISLSSKTILNAHTVMAVSLPPAPHQACHSGGGRAMLTWPCTDGWRDLGEEPLERIEFWGLSVLGEPMEFCCVRMERLGATCPWLLVKPLQWLWSVPNILAWRKCLSKNSIVIISAYEPEGKLYWHSHQSWILVGKNRAKIVITERTGCKISATMSEK